ncbi:MAG TPA: PIN domain-containing protein [Spirochaetota bacterium]|nr:PIN domain-containing protein [Spirochaetota bacterium]
MILVDTNIIIDFWKNPESKICDIFIQEDIATCGIILAELIHGAKSEKESAIIQEALSAFNYLDIRKNDWVGIGSLIN